MELMKISDNALKVSLTREDMELFDIEFESLDYSNAETRRIIWSILDEAKRTLGFEAVRENLYIQAFRSRCGGCELFVSRDADKDASVAMPILIRFADAESLISACARLENCHFEGESRLFFGDDERYYLMLLCEREALLFLDEVGCGLSYSEGYLAEHARLLCENAVEKMAKLR